MEERKKKKKKLPSLCKKGNEKIKKHQRKKPVKMWKFLDSLILDNVITEYQRESTLL